MAYRNLREARISRALCREALVLGVGVSVHEHDGDAREAVAACRGESGGEGCRIERLLDGAVRAHTLVRADHPAVQVLRLDDAPRENVGAGLGAYFELVFKPLGDDQHGGLALALEQRIGGNGGANPDGCDAAGGNSLARCKSEKAADAGDGGIVVEARSLRQQLQRRKTAFGRYRDDIGEGAAAVDPELPRRALVSHRSNRRKAL